MDGATNVRGRCGVRLQRRRQRQQRRHDEYFPMEILQLETHISLCILRCMLTQNQLSVFMKHRPLSAILSLVHTEKKEKKIETKR